MKDSIKNQYRILAALEPKYQGKKISFYKIHLVNETVGSISFKYQFSLDGFVEFSYSNVIEKQASFFLNTIEFTQLNDSPLLKFDMVVEMNSLLEINKTVKIKPKDLSKQLKVIPFLGNKGYLYQIHRIQKKQESRDNDYQKYLKINPDEIKEMMFKKESPVSSEPLKQVGKHTHVIIDLHIEKLVKDFDKLSNDEIIYIQLNHFRKKLDLALAEGISKMYVVHGIGKGTLKTEIFKILERHNSIQSYQNNYDKRFGFGATEIIFK